MRRTRHWKQRFNPEARMVFRRRRLYGGKVYERGDEIPEALRKKPNKLEAFWDSGYIEIVKGHPDGDPKHRPHRKEKVETTSTPPAEPAEETSSSGEPEEQARVQPSEEAEPEPEEQAGLPEGVTVTSKKGWHTVTLPDGAVKRLRGKKALDNFLSTLTG